MALMTWDNTGEKFYETGVDRGVLYLPNAMGLYVNAYTWNGLTAVTESPSGAEANKQYADNIVYLNLTGAEEYGFTIEAFTYPDEFGACDGSVEPVPGLSIGQQTRKMFGFSYRTKIGNDLDGQDHGYKLHLAYGCQAAPSEKAYTTINDSPEAITFSWEITTTPTSVGGTNYKPTSLITIDSTKVDVDNLADLEAILYDDTTGRLPSPSEVIAILEGTATEVTPVAPGNPSTNHFSVASTTGYTYRASKAVEDSGGDPVAPGTDLAAGTYEITEATTVSAIVAPGYVFASGATTSWSITYTP